MPWWRHGLWLVMTSGISGIRDVMYVPEHWRSYTIPLRLNVGFCHVDSCSETYLARCLLPGREGPSIPISRASCFLPRSSHLLLFLYVGYKVDLFVRSWLPPLFPAVTTISTFVVFTLYVYDFMFLLPSYVFLKTYFNFAVFLSFIYHWHILVWHVFQLIYFHHYIIFHGINILICFVYLFCFLWTFELFPVFQFWLL